MPASILDGAGMRRHLNGSHAGLPCSGAAESFVSFIPLFDSVVHRPHNVVISSESTLADFAVARWYAHSREALIDAAQQGEHGALEPSSPKSHCAA